MNKKLMLLSILILTYSMILLSGCTSKGGANLTKDEILSTENTEVQNMNQPFSSYQTISPSTAMEMMTQSKDIIILDVRTEEEFNEGYIENAILLPYTDIPFQAKKVLPDKEATILIYCRSGRRSAIAAKNLVELGYTNIYDFGGIIDWPGEIIK